MLDATTIDTIARAYHQAEKTRQRMRPPSVQYPGFTIEDANAGNAALIGGGRPMRPLDLDLRWVAALCYRNNVIEESGVAAAVLNHPANGVAWLANKLAPFDIALEPGQFVLGGSFTGVVEA